MELITILVIIVSVLTLLSGFTVFLGAEKFERRRSLMFFLTTLTAAIWSFSVIVFLNLPERAGVTTKILSLVMYIAPLFMVLAQVFYTGWHLKHGKILGCTFTLASLALAVLIIINPALLYSDIILSSTGNIIKLQFNWFYLVYALSIIIMLVTFVIFAVINTRRAGNKTLRTGNLFYAGALVVSGLMAVIFSLIVPAFGSFRAIWVGPFMLSLAVIVHFYSILRYHLLFLSSMWLRIGSYIILISVAAMVYMVVFFMVFSLLFKVEKIDLEMVLMNFIMIVIMLLILPVFHEATAMMRSLISAQDINMNYIVKKLNVMATQNVSLEDLAIFLADNLHYKYIGFVINKKLTGTKKLGLKKEELDSIAMLDSDEKGIWQKATGHAKEVLERENIVAVAELRNAKGRPFGQILVGKPIGKPNFEKKDLSRIESVINLVASIIDSEKRLKV